MICTAVKLKIYGHVQGVFYRHSTKQKARQLDVYGYVKNVADGTVELLAYGKKSAIDQLIKFCKNNPGSSQVETVKVEWIDNLGEQFSDFEIL